MTRCFVMFFDLHVQFWRNVCDDHIFRNFWSCLHVRDLIFCMFQFERNVLTIDLYFVFALSCIKNSIFFWSHVLKCFSSKCSIRCVSHRKFDQKLFHTNDVFLWFLFDLQYFRIDFKMFSSRYSIKNCLYCRRFFIILFDLQYVRIDFEMFFIKMFDQKLFVLSTFFLLKFDNT